jgi:hypothetical protein
LFIYIFFNSINFSFILTFSAVKTQQQNINEISTKNMLGVLKKLPDWNRKTARSLNFWIAFFNKKFYRDSINWDTTNEIEKQLEAFFNKKFNRDLINWNRTYTILKNRFFWKNVRNFDEKAKFLTTDHCSTSKINYQRKVKHDFYAFQLLFLYCTI